MKIRLKKRGALGVKRVAVDGKIGRIDKNEGLYVYFRGIEGVGMVAFGPKEMEMLRKKIGGKEKTEKKEPVKKKKKVVKNKGKK